MARADGPVGGTLSLEGTGTWQGLGLEDETGRSFEHGLREELRSAFDGYLFSQATASWRIGGALDNLTLFTDNGAVNRLSYQYDWRVSTWTDGVVPVKLYGSHQTNTPRVTAAPGDAAISDIYGYGTSLNLPGLPKLDSSGYYQLVETIADGDSEKEVTANLHGGLYQSSDNTVARASFDWSSRNDPAASDQRESRLISADANYRITPSVVVGARATGRSFLYDVDGEQSEVGNAESSAFVRYRVGRDLNGLAYVQQHRSVLGSDTYSGIATATSLSRRFANGLTADGSIGATYDAVADADGDGVYVGEFGRAGLTSQRSGRWGVWEGGITTGIANLTELGVGSGGQYGASARTSYGRGFFGLLQAVAGGQIAGQLDTSTLDSDFYAWGWNAAITSRAIYGLDAGVQASEALVTQTSRDEGNSDDLRVAVHANARFGAWLKLRYTFAYDRLVLDDEFSAGLGHTARVDVKANGYLSFTGLAYRTRWETSTFDATEWWRLEAGANLRAGMIGIQARFYQDYYLLGDADPDVVTGVLVEATRRFRWRF